ncbi:MAG: LytTR family transcriptional regulator [Tidjanibacter sp.]|nr:LytTR family transcriptional regulator [Tidjanibacter sp.]
MRLRRITALIAYWAVAIITVAIILLSLDYSFAKALFMSSLFLPGAVAAKFFLAQIKKDGSSKSVMNILYVFGGIAIMEFLLIVCGHRLLEYIEEQNPLYLGIGVADILVNPIFVAVIIFLILTGEHFVLQSYKGEPEVSTVSFTSDRHKVILSRGDIVYIESNDSEVWIYATEGRRFRNKTGITQWGNVLGEDFIRVHRSYIVNKFFVASVSMESLTLSEGITIPVSRKYRDSIKNLG